MSRRWIEVFFVVLVVGVVVRWQSKVPKTSTPLAGTPSPARASDVLEPFSGTARKGIVYAERLAVDEGESHFDCRHLVIGLRLADPRIDAYLKSRDVSLPKASVSGPPGTSLAPEAKSAIQLAVKEKRLKESSLIFSVDLFSCILRTESQTSDSLAQAGVSIGDFRNWLKQQPEAE